MPPSYMPPSYSRAPGTLAPASDHFLMPFPPPSPSEHRHPAKERRRPQTTRGARTEK